MKVLSLFDGISCGKVALERAGIEVDQYYASEIDEGAIAISKERHPDIVHLGSVTDWKTWDIDFSEIDLLIGGSPCFKAGTLITTDKGYKNIEDIQVGDMVLTHKNRFRKVVLPMVTHSDKIYEVCVQGSTAEVTEEHPYYVRESGMWWNSNSRRYERVFLEPKWKRVSELCKGDYIGFPINDLSENPHNLTSEDCWLLGRYLADGHYRKQKVGNRYKYQVIYSVGDMKVEAFKNAVSRHFSCYKHTQSTYRCVVSSKRLGELIELFNLGNRAYNKQFSSDLLNLPVELAKSVLDEYLSGDGYFDERRGLYKASTVSKKLAFGLGQLVMKVYRVPYGLFFTKRPSKAVICGRTVNQRDGWEIDFRSNPQRPPQSVILDGYFWVPFRRKKLLSDSSPVYNFEVEGDNSYVANNCIVHNCQGFSIAGKQLNFDDPRSKLFFEYVNILNEIKKANPNVKFLLENVKMKKEYENVITGYLGVEPIAIDSALVSAQRRKRLYWTNIEGVLQPEDKGIMLRDIVHENVDLDTAMSNSWCKWFSERMDKLLEKSFVAISPKKAVTMTARQYANWQGNFVFEALQEYVTLFNDSLHILDRVSKSGRLMYFNSGGQGDRVYSADGKGVTLCGEGGGRGAKMGCYLIGNVEFNDFSDARLADNQWFYGLTDIERKPVLIKGYIRKLTPIECERLQTLPDGYTQAMFKGKPISDAKRYKALGNGWTVDVIAHILRNLKA